MQKYILLFISLLLISGCIKNRMPLPEPPPLPPPPKPPELDYQDIRKQSFRSRGPMAVNQNKYEGSLWQDESSWGNLLRDHRARFKNDVITITNLQDIISISEPEKPKPVTRPTPLTKLAEGQAAKAGEVIDAVSEAMGESDGEKEQREVLKSLRTLSARVVSVLPNGNLAILAEKVDYKQQNSIRYVTYIKGIIRPEDVSDKNEISALKLARSEVQIKRQFHSKQLKLKALAPLIGKKKAGLLDRLSHMATPTKSQKVSKVNTKY